MPRCPFSTSMLLTVALLSGAVCATTSADAEETRTRVSNRAASLLSESALPTLGVSDFLGRDRTLARDLTFALLTELDTSQRLPVIERSRYQRALRDLDLASEDDLSASDARSVAQRINADRIVAGTFETEGNDLTVHARLLAANTGRAVSGSAFTVSGDRRDLAELTHRLARQISRRLQDLNDDPPPQAAGERKRRAEDETPPADLPLYSTREADTPSLAPAPVVGAEADAAWDRLTARALIPVGVRPGTPLSERDLTGLLRRVGYELAARPATTLASLGDSQAPVTRLRALAAFAKLSLSEADLQAYRHTTADALTPDADITPQWGLPFLAAAIDQGWWRADRALHAREIATWGFVRNLLARVSLRDTRNDDDFPRPAPQIRIERPRTIEPSHVTPLPPEPADDEPFDENANYTGLVIDAREFKVQRSISPRILDEDGKEVYPDKNHLPSLDEIEERGIAEYFHSVAEAKRAGDHPLVIRALSSVSANGHDDLIISNRMAERIRTAANRHDFLANWNVAILMP